MATAKPLSFVETFQFVEQVDATSSSVTSKRIAVPNHILESKIYAKVQQNAAVKASPAVVHFEGFTVGQSQTVVVSLCNVARDVVRMHIIPPQSRFFKIKYTKGDRLVPGMTMSCIIEFTPDEYRYYYDAIRIHSPGEDNVIIPIHAFPVMDAGEYPTQLKFPNTALGQKHSHIITLRCHVPVDFEFELSKVQDDNAYSVVPMSGIVPACGMTDITITYEPIAYCTSIMILQLNVSQFNAQPMLCNVTASCHPGSQARKLKSEATIDFGEQRVCSPLERSRQRKMQLHKKPPTTKSEQARRQTKKVIEKEGLRFPEKLNTVHHVSNVLLQTPGKMQLKELIEAEKSVSGRQMKENNFDQAIRKNVYEERQNQLRWQVKLGEKAMSQQDRVRVKAESDYAWQVYKDLRGDPKPGEESERIDTEHIWRRTIRHAEDIAKVGMQFDLYTNSPWSARHSATDRFAQVARKIILRNRAKKNLSQLKSFLVSWNKKQEDGVEETQSGKRKKIVPVIEPDDMIGDQPQQKLQPTLAAEKVIPSKYPFFVPPNRKDDMAPDALNEVITVESRVDIITKTPYFDLQVPQQYKLLSYNEHELHQGYDYVAPSLARKLRAGAKEEIVNLKKPHEVSQGAEADDPAEFSKVLNIHDVEKHESEAAVSTIIKLDPPEAMFKPIEYPPLHIFNATPGLQVFQTPVPYAEVDPDYHLCPLPKYIVHPTDNNARSVTQKQYLDREDVIKGTMSWKKFPSQGLTSLANTPTLTNVWVPRWSDPFSGDLLSYAVPSLQNGLAEDDILEHEMDSNTADEESTIELTPAMVAAQFIGSAIGQSEEKTPNGDAFPYGNKMPTTNIPVSSNGPVPREKREQELDYFLSKKSNRLGHKIQTKVDHLNSVTYRSDLVFK